MKRISLAAAIACTLALAGCDNEFGIFKSIQEEEKQTGFFEDLAVGQAAVTASTYWAVSTKLHGRAMAAGSTWIANTGLATAAGAAYRAVSVVAKSTDELYVAVIEPDAGVGVWTSADEGVTWTNLSLDASFTDVGIDALFLVNDEVFLQEHIAASLPADHTFALRHLTGTSLDPTDCVTAQAAAFVGGAWDGTAYWFAAGTAMYTGATPAGLAVDSAAPADQTYTAIAAASGSVRATRIDGTVANRDAGVWGSATVEADSRLSAVAFAGDRLLFATATGYEEVAAASWPASDTVAGDEASALLTGSTGTNYSTTLKTLPIVSFLWDEVNDRLFACAAAQNVGGSGLWSNTLVGTVWSGWTAE